jgi:hypothetical protein
VKRLKYFLPVLALLFLLPFVTQARESLRTEEGIINIVGYAAHDHTWRPLPQLPAHHPLEHATGPSSQFVHGHVLVAPLEQPELSQGPVQQAWPTQGPVQQLLEVPDDPEMQHVLAALPLVQLPLACDPVAQFAP